MMKITQSAVIATLMTATSAKRHLDNDIENHRASISLQDSTLERETGIVQSPLVEGADCVNMCLFQDQHNSYCWKFQSPMLTVGWDWKQSTGDRYFQMEFVPYIKPAFYFQSDLLIKRLYSNQVIVEMPEWTIDMYISGLFSTKGQMCVGVGWDLDKISSQVKTSI